MWTIEQNRIRLDISKIKSDFKIVSDGGLHLIHPRKNLWEWSEEDMWLRSIVVDNNGFIVSSSWKKFGNYGEFRQDTEALNNALANGGTVRFSHKEDGSLCIRFVYNGKVILRTRGTLFGGEDNEEQVAYGERFRKVAQNKYPILLDPNFMNDRSLMLEYVAPSNLVVVRYKEEDLIFLGFVLHNNLEIGKWPDVEKIASEYKLNLVRLHDLPRDPLKLLEEIRLWKDEGVVARCNNDQVFVKVKSAYYLANHRMKFSMNYLTMLEFIEGGDIQSETHLEEALKSCNYDWELVESAKEYYRRYVAAQNLKDNLVLTAKNFLEEFNKDWQSKNPAPKKKNWQYKMEEQRLRKKEFALLLNKTNFGELPSNLIRPMAFSLYDNKEEKLHNFCRKIILTEGKK